MLGAKFNFPLYAVSGLASWKKLDVKRHFLNFLRSVTFLGGYVSSCWVGVLLYSRYVSKGTITRAQCMSFAWLFGLWGLVERYDQSVNPLGCCLSPSAGILARWSWRPTSQPTLCSPCTRGQSWRDWLATSAFFSRCCWRSVALPRCFARTAQRALWCGGTCSRSRGKEQCREKKEMSKERLPVKKKCSDCFHLENFRATTDVKFSKTRLVGCSNSFPFSSTKVFSLQFVVKHYNHAISRITNIEAQTRNSFR